ncbi:unconventional prefoldin RPB5 interactor-like protein [Schistocerca nitens]|uniref:unconventional prefoldin RPB5 interactor-like protein n=1 Tax=Schistocerca nitens TaxID=7011 RepID=UPI002118C8CA|nr:unconventional prefoldin RPB5 interactor-like protein [Schistocerca nitens]
MAEENVVIPPQEVATSTYTSLLQQTYDEALTRNELNTNYWNKVKEEYKTLQSHLEVLPNDISKDVMVPVGTKALMKGKMVHTNEILVCLGDGWFVKQSAKQAAEICQRRMNMCDEMLAKLNDERTLLTSRKELPFAEEAFGNKEGEEILEPFDEEKEAEWRVQHRQKEREYRKKLAELRRKEKTEVKSEEDLWKRLDDLELQEELEEELDRLHADDSEEEDYEYEESDEEFEDNIVTADISNGLLTEGNSHDNANSQKERLVDYKEQKDTDNKTTVSDTPCESLLKDDSNHENSKSTARRVSFKSDLILEHHNFSDSEAEEPLHIEFKHSSIEPVKSQKQNEEIAVENPADIYDQYIKSCKQSSGPKSILKRTNSNSDISNKVAFHNESDKLDILNVNFNGPKQRTRELPVPVHIDVVEHGCASEPPKDLHIQTTRPVSKFRAARSQKR